MGEYRLWRAEEWGGPVTRLKVVRESVRASWRWHLAGDSKR